MAKQEIYVIFDKDAENYNSRTFNAPNVVVAKRIINDLADNDKTFKRNAEKFILYCLGEYNNESGELTANKKEISNCREIVGE